MADRYCRNCGHELRQEDRFCTGCGRAVQEAAHVPTPEVDVPVATPQTSVPPQPREHGADEALLEATRGPMRGMLGVFLVLGTVKTVQEMEPASSGETLSYRIGTGVPIAVVSMFLIAALILLLGGVYYITGRKEGVTFREAIFNWSFVIVAGASALLLLPL